MMIVRPLEAGDWDSVSRIYLQGIHTGIATFQDIAPSWEGWDRSHLDTCRIVAEKDGKITGWAALSQVSSRAVYRGVAEVSVYVDSDYRGQNIGEELLIKLIEESEANGFWTLQSSIFPENHASINIHEHVGFEKVGVRRSIGMKNGVWRDNVLMEKRSKVVGTNTEVWAHIPWNRMVHFFGRSSEYPSLFTTLLNGNPSERKAAIESLSSSSIHQETISQVTPFVVSTLVQIIEKQQLIDTNIVNYLYEIVRIVNNYKDFYDITWNVDSSLEQMMKEENLWPIYRSEEEDEIYWETWGVDADMEYWIHTSRNVLVRNFSKLNDALLRDGITEEEVQLLEGISKMK